MNGDGPSQTKRPRKEHGDSTAPFVKPVVDLGSFEMAVNTASPTSTIRSYGPIALPSLPYHPALQPVEPGRKASSVPQSTSYRSGERPGKLSPQQLLNKKSGKAYTGPFRSPLLPPKNLPSFDWDGSGVPKPLDESQHVIHVPANYNSAASDFEVRCFPYKYLHRR